MSSFNGKPQRSFGPLLNRSLAVSLTVFSVLCTFLSSSYAEEKEKKTSSSKKLMHSDVGPLNPDPAMRLRTVDPHTGGIIEFSFRQATFDQLQAQRPSLELARRKKMWDQMKAMCDSRKITAKSFATDFAIEKASMDIITGLSGSLQTHGDPAAARNLLEQSVLSPASNFSFLGFMAGSRLTQYAFKHAGFSPHPAEDPCMVLRRTERGKLLNYNASKAQKIIAPVIGPLGMAVGLIVSSSLHEILADPNVKVCAMGRMQGLDEDAKVVQACDKAYEHFVISKKINTLVPEIMSMTTAALLQAYVVNKGASKLAQVAKEGVQFKEINIRERSFSKIPGWNYFVTNTTMQKSVVRHVTVDSLRVVFSLGSSLIPTGGWTARIGMTLANFAVFIGLNELVAPPIHKGWQTLTTGMGVLGWEGIADSIQNIEQELIRTEKNNWVWTPKPKPAECEFNPGTMPMGTMSTFYFTPSSCSEEDKPLALLVKNLGETQRKWRSFLIKEMTDKTSAWQGYTAALVSKYSSAFNTYKIIVDQLYHEEVSVERHPEKKQAANATYLSAAKPFNGLAFNVPENICDIAPKDQDVIQAAQRELMAEIRRDAASDADRRHPIFGRWMESILLGLDATNCFQPFAPAEKALALVMKSPKARLQNDQAADIENRIRKQYLAEALDTLREAAQNRLGKFPDPNFNTTSANPRFVDMAQRNIFLRLILILGNTQPLPPGVSYLRELEKHIATINVVNGGGSEDGATPSSEDKFPESLRYASTPSTIDFLVASMVCGPEANPSQEIKVRMLRESRLSTWQKALNFFGLGNPTTGLNATPDELLSIDRVYQSKAMPEPRLLPPDFDSLATDVTLIDRQWSSRVDFRPPRIVDNLPIDFCSQFPINHKASKLRFDPYSAQWKADGKIYNGVLDVLRQYIKQDLLLNEPVGEYGTPLEQPGFISWWDTNVNVHVAKIMKMLRGDYEKIIRDLFIPRIVSQKSIKYGNQTLYYGTSNSIKADLEYNFKLIEKVARRPLNEDEKKKIKDIRSLFDLSIRLFSTVPEMQDAVLEIETGVPRSGVITDKNGTKKRVRRAETVPDSALNLKGLYGYGNKRVKDAFDKNRTALEDAIATLEAGLENMTPVLMAQAESEATLNEVREAALENIKALVTELDQYFGFVNALDITDLREGVEI